MSRKIGEEKSVGANSAAKRNQVITIIVIAVAVCVLVFALVNIIGIKSEDIANENAYAALQEYSIAPPDGQTVGGDVERLVDFDALRSINSDIIGWILVPETRIDYPVTVGIDNWYYMTHNANKTENRAGAIFLDMDSSSDFSDRNTVIFGHNMNDGSMFAGLHQFEDEAFFNDNAYLYLFTPEGVKHKYRVFSAHSVDVSSGTDEAYQTSFSSEDEFLSFLERMKGRSSVQPDVTFSGEDKIVTLSTCIKGQDTNRYVVQAVLEP